MIRKESNKDEIYETTFGKHEIYITLVLIILSLWKIVEIIDWLIKKILF